MEAEQVDQIPVGSKSQYEPKWDGFRCLIFRRDNDVFLQSKAGQPLGRYFPEIVRAVQSVKPKWWVLDGERDSRLSERRRQLDEFSSNFKTIDRFHLSPVTLETQQVKVWLKETGNNLDGVPSGRRIRSSTEKDPGVLPDTGNKRFT
jgi:ATP dependent DNA ligase domain